MLCSRVPSEFGVESKIELNLLEGLLRRKKNLGRHSRSVAIFLKTDFFKMADFCYGSLVNEKSILPNFMDYISLVRKFNGEQFFLKEVHAESQYFQGYLSKTIRNHAIIVK